MATPPKNFTPIEDVMLCRAYVNATLNPITGTDQKMEVFWRGIKGKFDELYAEADEVQEGVARAPEALMNRYMRKIQPEIKIPRPIGQKAAKRKAQEEISVARSQKTRTASMVQMTAIHERLAKSMEDNNQIDIRYKEFQMLKEINDVEGSRKCIEEIQQLQAYGASSCYSTGLDRWQCWQCLGLLPNLLVVALPPLQGTHQVKRMGHIWLWDLP
ncbi:hypothetical protein IV203_030609 [Nitzschia inconspicua]|uniref:No apical meristem-associated C-terminal domain-containing protein n=1 Tax=Nitzschia inconspicua TaxID=303405 RepID=A0A9K3LVM3_9STRA|nr:hypothetical protein IV203_030609 [Nitzschia inconspicua]